MTEEQISMIVGGRSIEERAILLHLGGVPIDCIAFCVGKSKSWVHRLVNPSAYYKHLEYNREWLRRKREQQKQQLADAITAALTKEQQK